MARPKDTLGVGVTAAHGLDTSWMGRAKCRGWNGLDEDGPTPWQVDPPASGNKKAALAREMIEIALMVCSGCPAQYDCAEYAVQAMFAGTWSMKIDDLDWLRRQDDRVMIIATAEGAGTPMQRAVGLVRVARETIAS